METRLAESENNPLGLILTELLREVKPPQNELALQEQAVLLVRYSRY